MATALFCREYRQYQTKIPKPSIMKILFFDRDRAIFDKLFDIFQSNSGSAWLRPDLGKHHSAAVRGFLW
ncbi:hypothetical protein QZP91_09880 [Serratia marcescens]|uniref:hypothetical protein n=1 Tax=Serratia marcescens TaxID=615 RepID=UPI00276418CF|nr:hypothetical protein [Serratia marcescens]MDP8669775.1 hypothetical protein [Serratia marcescens]MDP8694436.1 hypothetical protein [Serratia marcescens]MDP8724099.1 hypothetical protein [Serratia marcescens]